MTVKHILFIIAESRYFKSHRLSLARAALHKGYRVSLATRSSYAGFDEDAAYFKSLGISIYPLPVHRTSLNPLRDLYTLVNLVRIVFMCKPDCVHNVALKPVLYGTWAAKIMRTVMRRPVTIINALSGLGYVFTSTTRRARCIQKILNPLLQYTLRHTHIIVQNTVDVQHMIKNGHPRHHLHLLRGAGVNTDIFSPSPLLPAPESGPIILTCVARMLWSKGIRELLEVAQRLKKTHPQVIIQLVGEPDTQNPDHVPISVLHDAHNQGIIHFLGHQDHIQNIYQNSYGAILPSYREGLPKSLIEACACGLPLITTTAPGCHEMIENPGTPDTYGVQRGNNGFLVPPRDGDSLYHAVIALLDMSPDDYASTAHAARQCALTHFDEDIINAQTLELYR